MLPHSSLDMYERPVLMRIASRCWVRFFSFLMFLIAVPIRPARTCAECSVLCGVNECAGVRAVPLSKAFLHLTQFEVARLNWMSPQCGQRGTSNEGCGCMDHSFGAIDLRSPFGLDAADVDAVERRSYAHERPRLWMRYRGFELR